MTDNDTGIHIGAEFTSVCVTDHTGYTINKDLNLILNVHVLMDETLHYLFIF